MISERPCVREQSDASQKTGRNPKIDVLVFSHAPMMSDRVHIRDVSESAKHSGRMAGQGVIIAFASICLFHFYGTVSSRNTSHYAPSIITPVRPPSNPTFLEVSALLTRNSTDGLHNITEPTSIPANGTALNKTTHGRPSTSASSRPTTPRTTHKISTMASSRRTTASRRRSGHQPPNDRNEMKP